MPIFCKLSDAFDLVCLALLHVMECIRFESLCVPTIQMFIAPSVTTMSIAATRMYRSLADFVLYPDKYDTHSHSILLRAHCRQYHHSGKGPDNSQRNFHSVSIGKWATTMPNPRNRIEVEVHGLYEHPQPSTSQTDADENVTFMATDGQLGDKPHGLTSRELSS
jgi:hypothetical protein